jgi:exodeoxyribonuclease VII large subunit
MRAIDRLEESDNDVICIVRGGGSRGDLAAFDDGALARRIARCTVPVLTGIGRTGDVSVADLVAASSAITPTDLGATLVDTVRRWHEENVRRPAEIVAREISPSSKKQSITWPSAVERSCLRYGNACRANDFVWSTLV